VDARPSPPHRRLRSTTIDLFSNPSREERVIEGEDQAQGRPRRTELRRLLRDSTKIKTKLKAGPDVPACPAC
jgi:hypothetical protein